VFGKKDDMELPKQQR